MADRAHFWRISLLGVNGEDCLQRFFDASYAYDFERPTTRDRAYTTQPARHNEFNINLACVGAKFLDERVRGRFALQTGTSVNLNYTAEANNRELAQLIQEGVVEFRLANNLRFFDFL